MADPDDERTLLLVEDEALVALSEKQTLERYGYAVTAAYSGEEAVRIAEEQHVDLVLMDIDLGNGMDGTEAARRILSARELPVVFLTAHAEQEMVDRVKGITRYGYVLKNSGEFVLVESINMAFELFAARREAKSHAEYYRLITENSCDMITVFRNFEMEFVSPAVRRLMGYEPEELLSMDHLSLMHPDDRDRVAASIAYRIRHRVRESTAYEYRQRVKSGAYRWFETVVNSKRVEDGGDVITVLSTRDITARKEFEERLRESEARIRGFLEHRSGHVTRGPIYGTLETMNETTLRQLAERLADPTHARIVVPPKRRAPGFWFGSGNVTEAPDGTLYLVGRYRNARDRADGSAAGTRGVELAIFRSDDGGSTFRQELSFAKGDLVPSTEGSKGLSGPGTGVISIEGAKLRFTETGGVELFVSSEKARRYPNELHAFQDPGSGIWSIDRMEADSPAGLAKAAIESLFESDDPETLHMKDPVLFEGPEGALGMVVCVHPYNGSSSHSALSFRYGGPGDAFTPLDYSRFPRGLTWDVAISRISAIWPVPTARADAGDESGAGSRAGSPSRDRLPRLVFYDGGECMRRIPADPNGVGWQTYYGDEDSARGTSAGEAQESRAPRTADGEVPASVAEERYRPGGPRGYSCEELAGAAWAGDASCSEIRRLSRVRPLFASAAGTGAFRYIDVAGTSHGVFVTWEQCMEDGSHPLVMNVVSYEEIDTLLGG